MTAGEIFINIGIKGDSQALKTLSAVKVSLSDIKSGSLEAKAALFAVLYGLKSMMADSAQTAMTLTNFKNLTGISEQVIQRWQAMGIQSGVTKDEIIANFKGVQEATGKMLLKPDAPEYIGILSTVGLKWDDLQNTEVVINAARKFLSTTKLPLVVANQMMRSLGLTDQFIQMLRTSNVDLSKVDPSIIYGKKTISTNSQIYKDWELLEEKVRHIYGELTAKHGPSILDIFNNDLKLINDIIKSVEKLTDDFPALAEAGKDALEIIGLAAIALQGNMGVVTATVLGLTKIMSEIQKFRDKKGIYGEEVDLQNIPGWQGQVQEWMRNLVGVKQPYGPQEIAPPIHEGMFSKPNQNLEVNQTNHNYGSEKTYESRGDLHNAIKDAHKTFSNPNGQ